MSLRFKIMIPMIVLIILISGAIGYLSYQNASVSLHNALEDNMEGEAGALARAISRMTSSAMNDIQRVAGQPQIEDFFLGNIYDPERVESLDALLNRLASSYPDFDRLSLMDTKGVIVASTDKSTIGRDFSNRNYFQSAMADKPFLAPPYKSSVTDEAIMAAAAPVKINNRIVGVAYCVLSLKDLYNNSVAPIKIGDHGYGFILDAEGLIVAHNNQDWILNPDLQSRPYYQEMAAASRPGSKEFVGNLGLPVINYYLKEPFSGLTAVIQAETEDIYSNLDTLRNDAVLVSVVSIILGSVLVYFILMPVLRNIKRGVAFADQIAAGDLSGDLQVRGKDELGKLADSLRQIPEVLQNVIAEYKKLENNIEAGIIDSQGDPSAFRGDYAELIQGTNSVLQRLVTIIDEIPSPTVILDKGLRICYMNGLAKSLAGNDYKGRTSGEVFHGEDYGTPACALAKAASSGQAASAETVAHPGGRRMDISYTAIPMLDGQGKLAFVLQLITDLTEIKATHRTIVEVAAQATDISNRVAAASEELSAQVEQVTHGTERQRDQANSTATAMEEMTSTVLEVARNAAQASEEAENTRGKASEGAALVDKVIASIEEVNRVAQAVKVNTEELGQQAEAIGNIMNVISDIADQTNLLALNAAIEAARAGEAGRGFAVVADEVRKLAEKTMTATVEVGSSIKQIQESTLNNATRVAEAAQGVSQATELAAQSGHALEEIVRFAGHTTELVSGIATAAEQQSATSEEINRSVDEINRISGETSTGMVESSAAVHELAQMAQELRTQLERLQSESA